MSLGAIAFATVTRKVSEATMSTGARTINRNTLPAWLFTKLPKLLEVCTILPVCSHHTGICAESELFRTVPGTCGPFNQCFGGLYLVYVATVMTD